MLYVYPRLSDTEARLRLLELIDLRANNASAISSVSRTSHPKAAPVATGGHHANVARLQSIREQVVEVLDPWLSLESLPRAKQPLFDAKLGQVLHDSLKILPADAAHEETWNFLTLILLPDIAFLRFPELSAERALGTKRNVLRRAWSRWDILGPILQEGETPLGEDELVGLLERTAVARNRKLVHALAREVLNYKGTKARSEFARQLYKLVRLQTGPLMLDILDQHELESLVKVAAATIQR